MKSGKVHALFLFCCRDKIIGLFVNKEKCIFMNDDIVPIFSLAALQVFSPPVEHIIKLPCSPQPTMALLPATMVASGPPPAAATCSRSRPGQGW